MRTPPSSKYSTDAFTRLECLAILTGLGFLATITLPMWAGATRHSETAACANNLRQIGQAMRMWAHDHGGQMPWRVLESYGGTMPEIGAKNGTAWQEWSAFNEFIIAPQVLVCPSDTEKRRAKTWSSDPDGGLYNAAYRNNAVSYILGTDTYAEAGFAILSADRNLQYDFGSVDCSARVNNTWGFLIFASALETFWTNAIHGSIGNVLRNDGTVERTSSKRFKELIHRDDFDNGTIHFIPVR